MAQNDAAFLRPDLDWSSLWPSIFNPQGGALPTPRILQNGDSLQSEIAADGKVTLLRFAVGAALWEPTAGQAGTATVSDLQGNALLAIPYNGRNLPIQMSFNPPLTSTNGISVSAPSGTFRVWIQGFSRFGN
jgi:hypothetical protein